MKNCGSGGSNKIKTKLAGILEADESTRMRMGNSIPYHHEEHIAGKGENSLQHYNLVHKFIPMPQAMKIPAAKAAGDKVWEKFEKISAWNLTKVRSKKQVIDEARASGATVHLASLMDICHLKNGELEAKHQNYKGWVVCSDATFQKTILVLMRYSLKKGSSAPQLREAKVVETARMRRTSSWRMICFYSGKKWGCSKIIESSKIVMSRHLDSSTTTQMAKIMVQYGWPQSFLLSEICVVILWQDYYGKSNLRKSFWSTVGRRFPIGNAYSYTVKQQKQQWIKNGRNLKRFRRGTWQVRNKSEVIDGQWWRGLYLSGTRENN